MGKVGSREFAPHAAPQQTPRCQVRQLLVFTQYSGNRNCYQALRAPTGAADALYH